MLACDFGLSLDGYLKMLGQQGKSAHTLSAYGRDLTELVRLLTEGSSETAQDLKRRDFVAALKRLSQQGFERTDAGAQIVGVAAILRLARAVGHDGQRSDLQPESPAPARNACPKPCRRKS